MQLLIMEKRQSKFHFIKANTNLKSGMQKEAILLAKAKKIEKINLQFKKVWAVIHYEFWT